jgi:hypothetical protein
MADKLTNQLEKTSFAGVLKMIFYHPNFNVVAGLFGIIGTFLAIYFYHESVREPNLTYYVSSTRTPILQQGNLLNNLSVTYQGATISGDLSTAEIQIWNQGKLPIHKQDILKPLTIRTPKGERVYQTTVTSTRDVIGFSWINHTNDQSGVLEFDWNILEQNDCIKLQIIYGGNVNLPLIVDGIIEGQPKGITRLMVAKSGPSIEDAFVILLTILSLLLCFILFRKRFMGGEIFNEAGKRKWSYIMYLWFAVLFYIFQNVCLIYLLANFSPRIKPPFGF